MSTAQITKPIAQPQLRVRQKFVGAYYLLTILTGAFILFFQGKLAVVADLVVGVCYLAVTALLYAWSVSSHQGNGTAASPRSH